MPSNPDAENEAKEGTLYVVSTPIGHLADITLRALETLRAVNLIAAEDTRHTRKLLSYYSIHKPLISYHEHNARQRGGELLEKIASGLSVALVTDAGTPGVSDPGKHLIEAALERGMQPVAIPGATALISALVVSGLPTQPFVFLGFPPARGADRRRFFQRNARVEMTLILYESPKKLLKTLKDMLETWGERRVAVARELTKIHEEVFRGLISEALARFSGEVRGELTLVVEGAGAGQNVDSQSHPGPEAGNFGPERLNLNSSTQGSPAWRDELKALLLGGLSSKEAASAIAGRFNVSRRVAYQAALAMKKVPRERPKRLIDPA
ncbi:MAG: 16S rRNA (cytidine(1402)-2'-O)-methyltransferase [Syntrophobacteraceae bacterium]